MSLTDQTIAAIATALGEAGIGIVRLSGSTALDIADRIFVTRHGIRPSTLPGYSVRYGRVVDPVTNRTIDEAILLVMRAPRSYTGEDVVEFQCHGGVVVVQRVLEAALREGARLAEPGEFTKRAFLNGRIDLSQAEAVMDVVRSRTEASLAVAVDQLEGSLSRRIGAIREHLYDLVVRVEAVIDYPEDDIPEMEMDEMADVIREGIAELDRLIATADQGKVLREGLKAVITGKPNVGKSSLLNRLLDEQRALVTDIPGTTRDTIEEVLNLKGIPLRLIDTAGIRESVDLVERLGVERAVQLLKEADLIIHVLDGSVPLTSEDFQILARTKDKQRVIVINKSDLPRVWNLSDLPGDDLQGAKVVEISLLEGELDPLVDGIVELVTHGMMREGTSSHAIVTRARHKAALEHAKADLEQALATLEQGLPLDLISVGLQGALEHLGEITGETVRENVIERIFAQFCIGK
jgi:tRNA modification GTPase